MKQTLRVITLILSLFLLSGCVSKEVEQNKNVSGSLEELMTKVYQDIPEENRPMMLTNIEVNDENIEYYLGTKDIEIEEALASEPGIGSIAHSVVLARVKDNANIEEVKTKIKENINPRKWLCVGVEEDDVIVKNKGNLVILIMVQDNKDLLEKGFDNL